MSCRPQVAAAQLVAEIDAAADGREHAQRQHVHLHQAHVLQVVLVPLDDGAVLHRRVLHRHQPRELGLRQHEAAHVLAQVARKTHEVFRQVQPQLRLVFLDRLARALRQLVQAPGGQLVVEPLVVLGEQVHQRLGQAQRLAHVADGAARAVGDDDGGDGGALAPVLAVDVLDHFLAPLVLEVHVDVRRLVAPFLADEALQQRVRIFRVGRGDRQAIAHHRIGGRPAALAQDAPAAREAHDVVHRQKEHLVVALGDERQLLFQPRPHLLA